MSPLVLLYHLGTLLNLIFTYKKNMILSKKTDVYNSWKQFTNLGSPFQNATYVSAFSISATRRGD